MSLTKTVDRTVNRTVNTLYMIVLLIGGTLAALALSLMLVIVGLDPPMEDVRLLFLFMSASGGFSLLAAYGLYRRGVTQWFSSLRWTLLATCVMTVMLVFVNVLATARLMFISPHDLILTTALLLFGGAVSVISVHFLSNTLIDRIHQLGQAAQRVAQGDLRGRLDIQGRDELTRLASTFNQMTESLATLEAEKQQLEQTRRDLVAWVSHDLRTPLAVIRAMNESILDGVVTDPQTVKRYNETIQREVHHLGKMIDDLFDLAQIDAGHVNLTRERVSLSDMISDTVGSLSAKAEGLNISITGEIADDIDLISVAPDKIQRVLYNLLDNALRHSAPGGCVSLRAAVVGNAVRISVHNMGEAISPSDLPHIFNRFYRGEPSRTQADNGYRGTGLGLAIVRGFVEAHGGKVSVASNKSDGTTFIFTLPLSVMTATKPAIPVVSRDR